MQFNNGIFEMIKGNESHVGYTQIWGYNIIDLSNLACLDAISRGRNYDFVAEIWIVLWTSKQCKT